MIRVFYYDEETGDTIDSLHPEVCSKPKALALFNVLSRTQDTFFGLVDQKDTTVEFICLEADQWRADIPVPEEDGAYFCIVDTDTCIELIKCVYDGIPIEYKAQWEFEPFSKEYPYYVRGCAPRLYPMEIIFANLMWSDDDGISVPFNTPFPFAWGYSDLPIPNGEVAITRPVPAWISMKWLSLSENKFYSIKERLPADEIEQLLQETDEGKPLYDGFVVGIVPYGLVALWLHGFKRTRLIAWMKAEETEVDMKDFCPGTSLSRDEYVYGKLRSSSAEAIINFMTNGLPLRDLYERHMQQFTYRYEVRFGYWDEEKNEWKDYETGEPKPELDYIEDVLSDGTHDKMHDGRLMEYHSAGIPERVALQFHIKKREYSAFFWMDDIQIRTAFEEFYREPPGSGMDFVFRIDPEKNIYQIAFICNVAEETGILEEETYQFLVFRNKFECCRSENYSFPRGAWEWWYGEEKRLNLFAFK